MMGSTSRSTSRATESCTRRSSSLSAARTPNRSMGSSVRAALAAAVMEAAALATGLDLLQPPLAGGAHDSGYPQTRHPSQSWGGRAAASALARALPLVHPLRP